jgi:Asp-tRNA(Asn)/Glu-tRNA(Gln) amidotransferase A subunit family amidase
MQDLSYVSAAEALRLFRSRELSPVELTEAVIARAEHVEPAINAFAERFYTEAVQKARLAEKRYAKTALEPPRPLEGIPVAIKEEQPIAGLPLREGSLLTHNQAATVTHPVVERIIAAGGIVHARTTTPEFSCAAFTHSSLWGITRNPWNLEYSPGGSSGGSAAALAAGTTTLATGSDIGGSIRIPASFCGVVGYKPPYGRVPALPPFNLDHYCHDGPLARTVADCALLQNVISGPHALDVVSLRPAVRIPDRLDDVVGLKVALSLALGDHVIDPDVSANTLSVANALREAGAVVDHIDIEWHRGDILRAAQVHFGAIFAPAIAATIDEQPDLATPYTKKFVQDAQMAAQATSYLEGLAIEAELYAKLGELLEVYDVLICPTAGIPAFRAGEDFAESKVAIGGVELGDYFEALLTPVFNMASRCPVLSVPSGRASNGIPTGVQIVGRTYEDEMVFRVAAALERIRPWFGDSSWRPPL